jgi:hypothetical protein
MSSKLLRILELSVIIIQFIASIVTTIYCSYCISNINNILFQRDYKHYISDYKKRFRLHLNVSYSSTYVPQVDNSLGYILKGQCTSKECKSETISSNWWNSSYIVINKDIEYDNLLIDFQIIETTDVCSEEKIQCFKNSYYKTCINKNYSCPITGIISDNTENMLDKLNQIFPNDNFLNSSNVLTMNKFRYIDENEPLMSTTLGDGIPIVSTKFSVTHPCHLDEMVKSYAYLLNINETTNSLVLFNCEIFENYDNRGTEGDFDLDLMMFYKNFTQDLKITEDEQFEDHRYVKILSTDLNNYLQKLDLNTINTENKTMSLFTRKMLYAKKECMVKMFKIISQTDVFNIAQVRILLLRYLNWTFIDIIFIIILDIYMRSYYLIKRLKKTTDEKIDEDERKFQKETNTVVKSLHYFIYVIKLLSSLVSKYLYMDIDVMPKSIDFYDECLTDAITAKTYKIIHSSIIDLFNYTSHIANINIYTLVYDFLITFYIFIGSYTKKRDYRKKIKLKFR